MVTLTETKAVEYVRKNLDEQGINLSEMYQGYQDEDNSSIDDIIKKTLPEAINAVCISSPHYLLEGEDVKDNIIASISRDRVISIEIREVNILRLVGFKVADSDITITDVVPEVSPEGRKQLNPFVRGTYDNPVLVQIQGQPNKFKYYTAANSNTEPFIDRCDIVKVQKYEEPGQGTSENSYDVPTDLIYQILYQLTGMVLDIYDNHDKAQIFYSKIKYE